MRFAVAAAAAGFAGVALAQDAGWPSSNGTWPSAAPSDVYVTEVVTAFTTYCPEATAITHGGQTYSVTEATTLTITNCPCTVTKPATSSSVPVAPVSESSSSAVVTPSPYSSAVVTSASSSEVSPVAYSSSSAPAVSSPVAPVTVAPYPSSNGTAPAPYSTGAASPTGAATSSSTVAPYTGAANQVTFAAGAGLLAIFGLVAAL